MRHKNIKICQIYKHRKNCGRNRQDARDRHVQQYYEFLITHAFLEIYDACDKDKRLPASDITSSMGSVFYKLQPNYKLRSCFDH